MEIIEGEAKGGMPNRLYKYRPLNGEQGERVVKTIIDSQIYLSSPSAFNDIFDCRPVFSCSGTDEEFVRLYVQLCRDRNRTEPIEELLIEAWAAIGTLRDPRNRKTSVEIQRGMATRLQKSGVYSMSEKRDDLLMWAHYANNHSGVCLEFDGRSELMRVALRVIYSDHRPVINRLANEVTQTMMEKALLTKSSHWSYEREWRLIHVADGFGFVDYDPAALTGVIFGAEIRPTDEELIRDAVIRSRSRGVKFYRATADDDHFKVNVKEL